MSICAVTAEAQGISTRTLDPAQRTSVRLSQTIATVIKFPKPFNGVFGYGISAKDKAGVIEAQPSAENEELILHALVPGASATMTVLMDGTLYVLDLVTALQPDVALTLVDGKASAPPVIEVTPQSVVDARPRFDDQHLTDILDTATAAPVLAKSIPDVYNGFQSRACRYESGSDKIKTVITRVSKFPSDDAIVMFGSVENQTDQPFNFDSSNAQAAIGGHTRPLTLISCERPIPAHGASALKAVIVGDVDGSRTNISLANEFRVLVSQAEYGGKEPSIPGYQTGPVIKEDQKPPTPLFPNLRTSNQ